MEKKQVLRIAGTAGMVLLFSFLIERFIFEAEGTPWHGIFHVYRFALISAIGGVIGYLFLSRRSIGERPEVGFLAVTLICGTLLSFSEPAMFVNWDEQTHFKRAERMARNIAGVASRPSKTEASYSLSEQERIDAAVDGQYEKPSKKSKAKPSSPWSIFSYEKLCYFPSMIAMILGEFLHFPYHVTFIFGRWINVLVYAVIVFFAIKKLKSGKMIMAVVALFPTALFLASNYNYDSWVTAFTLLGLAYVFSEYQQERKKISMRDMGIMIGAFVLGLGPKAIYFPLMFSLFILPKSKFSSAKEYKRYLLISSLAIVFVIATFLLPFLVAGPGSGDRRGGEAVNATQQVAFIMSDPIAYGRILANFMIDYINPLNAAGYMAFFAYLGPISGFFLVLAITVIVTCTDKGEYDKKIANWKMRSIFSGIFLITTALICTALYISFTAVRNDSIAGVQPRYLIPLAFPLLLVIGSGRFKNPINKTVYNITLFAIMAGILLLGIWDAVIKTYTI